MNLADHPKAHQLRQVVVRLDMMSHANGASYEFAPNDVGRGDRWRFTNRHAPVPHLGSRQGKGGFDTKTPRGTIDWKGDKTPEFRQKSAEYFRRRAGRVKTIDELEALLSEAQAALDAWGHTPTVRGIPYERETFLWKCAIADDPRDIATVATFYAVGRRTVSRYRTQFRGVLTRAA